MQKLQIIVPMAGAGKRFVDAGYNLPKPLIPVSGLPMVVRAVRNLPPASRLVFVLQAAHVAKFGIDRVLQTHFPDCRLVVVDRLTEGQACTVRLAVPEIDLDAPVIVAACDCTHLYDMEILQQRLADPATDALLWTYRGDPRVQLSPHHYGWVRTNGDVAVEVSCKKPISNHPIDDHVLSGYFAFRTGRIMLEGMDAMIQADCRVNGEFYMDLVANYLMAAGRRVRVFEVDKYIGWGRPEELEEYQRWERYFAVQASRLP